MNTAARWSRILGIAGLVVMLIGSIDPLEGSLLIVPGVAMVAFGAMLGKSRHRVFLYRAFVLVAIGVAALWGVSSVGGFGGYTGRSNWWALVIVPYPVGWIMALVGAIRRLREKPGASVPAGV